MSATTRVAITGGEGRLGTALRAYFPNADFLSHDSCDVGDWQSVRRWFGQHRYDLILHLGAVTAHNATPEQYWHTNVMGTAHIAQWAKRQDARLVYTSTDYCYAGTGQHRETDPVFPRNGYAWSKLGGECAVQLYDKAIVNVGGPRRSLYEIALAFNQRVQPIPRTEVQCGYPFPKDVSLDLTRFRGIM